MYREIVRPILGKLDSETMHHIAIEALQLAEFSPLTLAIVERFAAKGKRFTDQRLHITLGGIEFENPVVVGAGWTKSGKALASLQRLGFAGVEIGSILVRPQEGNKKPRQFMIAPNVCIQSLGFNSPGMEAVAQNIKRYKRLPLPIGISIGKNKNVPNENAPESYASVANYFREYASYYAINVSSPNTPELRELQEKDALADIISAVLEVSGEIPLFVKVAPDLTTEALDDVIRVAIDMNLSGIIASNTTIRPDLKAKYGEKWRNHTGGLSGSDPDYQDMTTRQVAHVYNETNGQLEIIGVGGVNTPEAALTKIKAGARIVQVVTGIREKGPAIAGNINRGISNYLDQEGIHSVNDIIGIEAINYR